MNEIEKKLVDEFVANANEIKRLENEQKAIQEKLIEQAPHKRGDVIKWTETGRTRNVGTCWNPNKVPIADSERKAVVVRVCPHLWVYEGKLQTFKYDYVFHVLKKDGSIGVNEVHPYQDYEWTGEHVDLDDK
jgi:hypothetical protein